MRCIVAVSKTREQQLSAWPAPCESLQRKQATWREKKKQWIGIMAKNTMDSFRERMRFVARIDRLFREILRPMGQKIRVWLDEMRIELTGGILEIWRGGEGQNSCDYDRSCPTIDATTIFDRRNTLDTWKFSKWKYKSLVSFFRISE